MESPQIIYYLLSVLVSSIPQFIVVAGGIFYCFSKMSKNPRAGKIALIGLGILFFTILLGFGLSYLQFQLPFWFRDSYQMIGYISFGIGFLRNIIWSVGLGFIIYAIWSGRE